MSYTYAVSTPQGWEALSDLPLDSRRLVRVSTRRTMRGLVSSAQVCRRDRGPVRYDPCGDFRRDLVLSDARATESNVSAQHAAALEKAAGLLGEITTFYLAKDAAEALAHF